MPARPGTVAVLAAVADALRDLAPGPDGETSGAPVVVAFSGGLDSTVLLDAAVRLIGPARCIAVHVHHGLQPAADDWPAHCAAEAARQGARFLGMRLTGTPARGESVECWGREARYARLAEAARQAGAFAILTAHHADDQAETLLMRIGRGTGPDGLVGIRRETAFGGIRVIRPLLDVPRDRIEQHARERGLSWVEDPTNTDQARLRNAYRHRILPALDAVAPAFRTNLLRFAEALDDARAATDALADIDLAAARPDATRAPLPPGVPGGALRVDALAGLEPFRRRAALRRWIASLGLPAPTAARLGELDRQLLAGGTGRGSVLHSGCRLVRDRGWLFSGPLEKRLPAPVELSWTGEGVIALASYRGELRFESTTDEDGVSAQWLRGQVLVVRPGAPAARIRPAPGGRSRTLKNLYQEAGVPASARPWLPVVLAGDALLYAAGIGMDHGPGWPREGPRVRLRWVPAAV